MSEINKIDTLVFKYTIVTISFKGKRRRLFNIPVRNMPGNSSDNGIELSISVEESISLVIFTSLQILIGSFANCIVIITISMAKELRKRSEDLLILNLAVTDVLSLTTCLPWLTYILSERKTPEGGMYFIYPSIFMFVIFSGAFAVLAIGIDRFIALVVPLRHKTMMTRTRTTIMIIALWVTAVALGIMGNQNLSMSQLRFFRVLRVTSGLFLLIIIAVIYIIIFYCTIRQSRKILNQRRSLGVDGGNYPSHLALKITMNSFVLVCLFYATYLPLIVHSIHFSLAERRRRTSLVTDRMWIQSFMFLNSCVNPFVYGLRTKRYKKTFHKRLWSKIFHQTADQESHT